LFWQVSETKTTPITAAKLTNIFGFLQPKAKALQPSIQAFPTKGNSNKNFKKKEHNFGKREVLQAHVAQIQNL
jgi:hypothetical protein